MVTFVFYVIPTRNIYFSPKAKNRSINFHNVFAQKFSIQVKSKYSLSMKQRKIWQQGISFLLNARKESFDGESICRITLAKKWGVVACKIKLLSFPAVIHFVKIFA
jgi:hypothetical protein